MVNRKGKPDRHFPTFIFDNPVRRFFSPPMRLVKPFVARGETVADLGSGPGYHSIAMAEIVGPEGKVYAVDSDARAIRAIEEKARARGLGNIEAHASSASEVGFIANGTVDFVLAHGLLCCVAPYYRGAAVEELKRIMKPDGLAYISIAKGSIGYVNRDEWERILAGFRVKRRGEGFPVVAMRWAIVGKA